MHGEVDDCILTLTTNLVRPQLECRATKQTEFAREGKEQTGKKV